MKTNFADGLEMSAIASLIKASLMFQKEIIPPQVGIPEHLGNFECLDRSSILIPGNPVPFSSRAVGQKRNIIVNNFDAAVRAI